MGAGRCFRSLLEMHLLMQVWGCVGCVGGVGVLLPVRTPSNQDMAVRPSPPVDHLLSPCCPGALPPSGAHTAKLSAGHDSPAVFKVRSACSALLLLKSSVLVCILGWPLSIESNVDQISNSRTLLN